MRLPAISLDRQTILVTGAAQGLGAAIARHLAGQGARLILMDRSAEGLAATLDACPAATGTVVDLADAADGMHCLDGSIETGTEVPDVSLGLKSVLFVELIAQGARRDVHSLNFPLVPAPVWDLVRALSTIMDENRRILVEGWYEGLWQLGPDDEEQLRDKAGRVDLEAMKEEWGIDAFAMGRDGIDAVRARTYEPTANIQGIIAGYTGSGTKTIVPNEARARLDFRLIPNIQPDAAIRRLKTHLVKHGFGHIEVRAFDGAEPPYKISVKEDIAQAIIAAATEVYGELPIVNGVSAEGAILRHVWIPCVLTGFANPGANLHAPDENIHVDKYIQGIKYAAAIMEHFGRSRAGRLEAAHGRVGSTRGP